MTEEEARAWLVDEANVSRGTFERIEGFIALLREENVRQNLVAAASLDQVWSRHIVDSVQLLQHGRDSGTWGDLGSGAGFPGLMIALLHPGPVTLIEQRRLRADFLTRAAEALDLGSRVRILCANVHLLREHFDVISARAFAPLDRLFAAAHHRGTEQTRWVLPKGRNAKSELDAARASWQGDFRLERSVTDPDAAIIVAERVRPRMKGKGAG